MLHILKRTEKGKERRKKKEKQNRKDEWKEEEEKKKGSPFIALKCLLYWLETSLLILFNRMVFQYIKELNIKKKGIKFESK